MARRQELTLKIRTNKIWTQETIKKVMEDFAGRYDNKVDVDRVWLERVEVIEDPKHCPYCGSTDVVETVDWNAVSQEDSENTALLAEYQCRPCGNRSFWIGVDQSAVEEGSKRIT